MPNLNQLHELETPTGCAVCEAMLPDAVDGNLDGALTEAQQRAFDIHVAGCVECARELAEARRGAAWLTMLKAQPPEPPAGMLARILANTANADQPAWATAAALGPDSRPREVPAQPSFWARITTSTRILAQPRLAMTAAMAFFSLALTFNLVADKLSGSHLTPTTLVRSAAELRASAIRTFQNQRVVYQFESRVTDLTNPADRDR